MEVELYPADVCDEIRAFSRGSLTVRRCNHGAAASMDGTGEAHAPGPFWGEKEKPGTLRANAAADRGRGYTPGPLFEKGPAKIPNRQKYFLENLRFSENSPVLAPVVRFAAVSRSGRGIIPPRLFASKYGPFLE